MWIGRHCYVQSRGRRIPVPCNSKSVVPSQQAKSAGLPQLGSMDLAQLKEVLAQVQAAQIEDHQDDEDYAEHYKEAAELQQQIQQVQEAMQSKAGLKLKVAQLQCRRGLALVQTDLVPEGEKEILQALPVLEPEHYGRVAPEPAQQPVQAARQQIVEGTTVLLQSAYNALGALWTRRGDLKAALLWLDKAQRLASDCDRSTASQQDCDGLEAGYTTTTFFLAQVHGHAGNKLESAAYCGRTLQRQLTAGTYDRSEWVQNCLQLAGYYVSINAFQVAAYCIAAAHMVAAGQCAPAMSSKPIEQSDTAASDKTVSAAAPPPTEKQDAVLDTEGSKGGPAVTTPEAASAEQLLHQGAVAQGEHASPMPEAQTESGVAKTTDATLQGARPAAADEPAAASEHPQAAAAAGPGHTAGPAGTPLSVGGSGQAEGQAGPSSSATEKEVLQVDSDVAANLELAYAKLCRQQLSAAHNQHVLQHTVYMPDCDGVFGDINTGSSSAAGASSSQQLPAPEFVLTGLPSVRAARFTQNSVLPSSFDQARALFNQGMEHYNTALKFYELDGYVTEHVGILLEISQMYKLLAGFEPSPLRRAAMHKQRVTRLQPVSGDAVSHQAYRALVRSVELECGSALRDSMEARLQHDGSPTKHLAAAGLAAVQHYAAFMNTFRPSPGEPLPDSVPEDQEAVFLNAAFCMGRLMHHCAAMEPPGDLQCKQLASTLSHLEWVCQYVQRNQVAAFKQEAELAAELAQLVGEKLKLLQRVKAKGK